jgi:hypothetical protein
MNGCYLKGEAITPDEAAVALRLILTRSSAPDSWEREMAALRQAARDILVVRVARPPFKSPTSTASTGRSRCGRCPRGSGVRSPWRCLLAVPAPSVM